MVEAGRMSLPYERYRSPSENIAIGGGATVGEVLDIATRPGGSLASSGGGYSSGGYVGRDLKKLAAEKEAERKRLAEAAELKRQQDEARKLAADLKQQREQKASSQKIGGQLGVVNGTNQTNQNTAMPGDFRVDVYNPEDRYTQTPYRQSFGTSTSMAIKSFGANVFGSIFGKETLKPIKEHTEVFKYSEGLKRDVVAYTEPQFGTQQTDPLTGTLVTGEVTYGDIQRKVEKRRDVALFEASGSVSKKADVITSSLQKKVDTGELTVTQAQSQADKQFDVLNKEYVKKQEDIYKKEKDVPGVFERTGKARRIANIAPDLLVVGAAAGVGLINPVAGASIATGYFAGKGIVEATYKPTYKEVGQQGGLYAGVGEDEKGRLSILEPTELDTKFKGYRQSAGINLLFAASGGVGMASGIDKAFAAQQLVELGESPVALKSVSAVKGDTSYDVIKGIQTNKGLTRQFTITGKVIKQGDKSFIMPAGKGYSTTTGRVGIIETNYAAGDIFAVGTKGSSLAVKDGFISLGKGVIEPRITFGGTFNTAKEFANIGKSVKVGGTSEVGYFAGASKKLGVDVTGAEYYKSISGGINLDVYAGKGFKAFKFTKPSGIDAFGIHKVIKVGGSSIDDIYRAGSSSSMGGSPGTGEGLLITRQASKSFKGFGSSPVPQSLIQDFSKKTLGIQAKVITKPTITSGVSFALPSVFSGTGQYERTGAGGLLYGDVTTSTTTPVSFGIMKPSQVLVPKVKDVTPFGLGNILGTSRGQSGTTKQLTTQLPMSGLLPRSMVGQDIITGQKLRQRTIQKQIIQQPLVQTPRPFGLLPPTGFGGGFGFGLPYLSLGSFGSKPTKRKPQRGKQKTAYQTSLTGSILGIRGTGLAPGGLSIRGILNGKKAPKINKPIKIL